MTRPIKTWIAGLLLAASATVCAAPAALDPVKIRSEAIALAKELRCPASLNQSLYESEKPIASELKAKIYELLREGKSREEIFAFFSERYGEQIRYEPAKNASTAVLWVFPAVMIVLLGAGGVILVNRKRKQNK